MDRRFFLAIGFVSMLFCSVYQYSWNEFMPLMVNQFHETASAVEVAFALFVVFSTSFQVLSGRLSDIKGPRYVGLFGALALSLGLILSSFSPNVQVFYLTWTLGSIGEGTLYGLSLNLALKWFPERRGLITGLVSMGFGLGAALFNPFIAFEGDFRTPTLLIGLSALPLALLFSLARYPESLEGKEIGVTIRESRFWLIYACFALSSVPLLVISSSLSLLGNYLNALDYTVATVYFPITSGLGRPLFGYLTDKLGRIKGITYVLIGSLVGVSLTLSGYLREGPELLIGVALIGITGGATFPLYSALVGDIYGPKYSASSTSILYTGKIISGLLGTAFSFFFGFNQDLAFILLYLSNLVSFIILMIIKKISLSP
ncbi:MFS transporter [Metallosphaera cuprina]|uniref:MFS transporter n=1 Tax=Metallosphaera cuprina TaxID=1006005 RepID=UPI00064F68DA|nr:MFS transporter [Metallosphaera cuprina]